MSTPSPTDTAAPERRDEGLWYGRGLILLGLVFLLEGLGVFDFDDVAELAIPLCLIALGGWWIRRTSEAETDAAATATATAAAETGLDVARLLGDVRLHVDEPDFRGGRVRALCGTIDLDLSACRVAPGSHRLTVSGCCGSIRVTVPRGARATVQAHSVFGDMHSARAAGDAVDPEQGDLLVVARQVLGDVHVT